MSKVRARDLGIPFDGQPGALNAITDVAGVEVGMTTLVSGEGPLDQGKGPVRTGVTVIHPRGRVRAFEPVWAGRHTLNGNGEMTGVHWIDEAGYFTGPVAITNTNGIGMAHHGVTRWLIEHPNFDADGHEWSLPVVAETWDGYLNDINGLHIHHNEVMDACDAASAGTVEEGNVGGGTGMICYEFKGGTGTASRVFEGAGGRYTLGVLVQANFGRRDDLMIRGVPVGRHLQDNRISKPDDGSIIAVAATDAPLMPHELERVAQRLGFGIGRTGTIGSNSSGDILLAFSTANDVAAGISRASADYLSDDAMDAVFRAAVEATEEAIINAMVAAETMTGRDGRTVHAIDHDALAALFA
ncbi:MAG: P1 family peptidase [Rhodospirillales bacterium]